MALTIMTTAFGLTNWKIAADQKPIGWDAVVMLAPSSETVCGAVEVAIFQQRQSRKQKAA